MKKINVSFILFIIQISLVPFVFSPVSLNIKLIAVILICLIPSFQIISIIRNLVAIDKTFGGVIIDMINLLGEINQVVVYNPEKAKELMDNKGLNTQQIMKKEFEEIQAIKEKVEKLEKDSPNKLAILGFFLAIGIAVVAIIASAIIPQLITSLQK